MSSEAESLNIIGIGSPVVDMLARVEDLFLEKNVEGDKGGMVLVSDESLSSTINEIKSKTHKAPGGSAGNTMFALAEMGIKSGFLGKVGMDSNGDYYKRSFENIGGDVSRFRIDPLEPTARSLCLVTPDAERTMRTHLGAAMALSPEDISKDDFLGYSHLHTEGYLLFNRDLIFHILESAKSAGCTISMDLASFEVVDATIDVLPDLLKDYIDIVFANEDEVKSFCKTDDPSEGADILGKYCNTSAVKIGEKGAFIVSGDEKIKAEAVEVPEVVDTTGAGDFWAAGFLYGFLQGKDLKTCSKLGALLGGEVVSVLGASIPDKRWDLIKSELK
jgi:sugar/nucleoside kinase (ribokinase family)